MKKDWWQRFVNTKSSENIDTKRKKLVLFAFTYIGGTILVIFGIKTPAESNLALKVILLTTAVIIFSNAFVSYFHEKLEVTFTITGLSIIPMVWAIVYTGGHLNTGLYWTFPFPITLFILFGYLRGLQLNIVLFSGIAFLVLSPEQIEASYRIAEVSRYFAAYIVNIILCLIGEYYRSRSHTELTKLSVERQRQANTDPLTKLPNRRFINTAFMNMVTDEQFDHFPITIAVLDVDHFKQVNDNYGHDAGDLVLKQLADVIKSSVRDTDIVARTGGEEFLMIFLDAEIQTGLIIAEKVREAVENSQFDIQNRSLPITVSIGCVEAKTYQQFEQGTLLADKQLYKAKSSGRNCIC
ncbi:GGDEF domain-containing protein [Thalassotalea sp. M1531]|uniref:diguanylate cyclase n=1 Tax=Thalassotalea algicola TaxID=2716224 RepID=A0A7Y0LBR9_9GAMM|nr:GGDEF domain-containing protein [Thalassotalea algicola]NMP31212.1 GGDEF domain-containing protein [Thalassotalea algicola]